MSLDVYLTKPACQHCGRGEETLFTGNVTHNLNTMAKEAGVYDVVWRPDEHGITTANQLIEPLREGIKKMEDDPDRFRKHNPENGWGTYEWLLSFLRAYLQACIDHPTAMVDVSR